MGHEKTYRRSAVRATLGICALALWLLAFAPSALAGPPFHPREKALDITGQNHACGTAVDSEGDVYVASAGNGAIDVFNPSHEYLTTIVNTNEPCGLAVDSKGNLYVSEKATGKVLRYHPTAYPFAGAPSYEAPVTIDSSGEAKGIAIDRYDDRLYVAEGSHVAVYTSDGSFEANLGEGDLGNATGVAAYSYPYEISKNFEGKIIFEKLTRHLFVADASNDTVKVFSGPVLDPKKGAIADPKLRKTLLGPKAGESFGFGAAGASLAADPGNGNAEDKCTAVAGQACTAGHIFVYDASHGVVDEFEASGQFLDQFGNPGFADAEPTAVAIDRSGGANDGTVYVSAGAGAGAKLLAFGPLAAPSRLQLGTPLSRVLASSLAVTVDDHGNVYVAAGSSIRVFSPTGAEVTKFTDAKGSLEDLAVDSTGKVYVVEEQTQATYYTPSAYPPVAGTTYARHEPAVATAAEFPAGSTAVRVIAINPANDHLFVTSGQYTHEHDSAKNGSAVLNPEFAAGLLSGVVSIAVDRTSGQVYFGQNPRVISAVNPAGTEVVARINGTGCPGGKLPFNPYLAMDQANGHLAVFDNHAGAAREYEASGACVAEFGSFTKTLTRLQRVAMDSSCALHDPPLDKTTTPTCAEYDPANGNVYVAFDDTATGSFDVTAFGPLNYGEAPIAVSGIATDLGGGNATLNGTVNPRGFDLTNCHFEYLTDVEYRENVEEAEAEGHEEAEAEGYGFEGAASEECAETLAEIGKGTAPVSVQAELSGLDPQERYRFRLLAANAYGQSGGDAVLFGVPLITAKSALPVLYSEASLRAKVDPTGLPTKYHFEYITQQDFEDQGGFEGSETQQTPEVDLTSNAGPTDVQADLTGLVEGTAYRFRAVAENDAGTAAGADEVFTTQEREGTPPCPNAEYRTGLSAKLPDCRAYELVTPAETNGLSPYAAGPGTPGAGFNNWLATPRGVGAGESLAYFTDGTLPGFEGNGRLDGYRAQRGDGEHPAEGWRSEVFSPSFAQSAPDTGAFSAQHGVASDQLYSFWRIEPKVLFEGTLPGGLYLRGPAGFELLGQGSLGTDLEATSRFLSAGGAHAIFASKAQLEPEAPPAGTEAVYDRAAGASSASVVSIKPDGSPFGASEAATYVAASEDGGAVLFKVGGTLYLHRAGQSFAIAPSPNIFAGVSEDGKRVFYAAGASGSVPATLFACDIETGSCTGPGAHSPTEIAPSSIFVNVSPGGSGALFTSEAVLPGSEENEAGEAPEATKHNLYAWDGAGTRFIAQLDAQDFENQGFGVDGMSLGSWTTAINPGAQIGRASSPTRSTPDGEVFVFQSHAKLTAYDNEGHGEIYRYEPGAPLGQQLLCVSCDPSGASPSADALLQNTFAGSGVNPETLIANLTDDGQAVFFQSADRLLPKDANDALDVYQWKTKGVGSCKQDGGCLALISSGQGEKASFLYGMSADGHDVFFRTPEKLVGADVPGSRSIYDARVNGGIPDPPPPAPCQGDACQGNGSPPPVLPSPASTGSGNGNVRAGTLRPRCPKGKRKVRSKAGKTRCVKRHGKKQHKKRQHRANHERRAQR